MTNYVELAQNIATALGKLPEVRAIISENSLSEFDHAHPYMSINLNIYYAEGGAPQPEERRHVLEDFDVEISNETRSRTYAHITGVPLELRCIDQRSLDYLIKHLDAANWIAYEKNTEIFYSILNGSILIHKDDSLQQMREFLSDPPEQMWINLKSYAVSRMTLDLGLLEDALAHHDRVLTLQAQGRFLEALLQVLFLSNKQFTPPLRLQQLELEQLSLLPFDFARRFDEFLDLHLDPTQRLEISLQLATDATLL